MYRATPVLNAYLDVLERHRSYKQHIHNLQNMQTSLDREPAPKCPRMQHYDERKAKEREEQKKLDRENMKYIAQLSTKRNDRNSARRNWLQTKTKKQEQNYEEEEEQFESNQQDQNEFNNQEEDQERDFETESSQQSTPRPQSGMIEQSRTSRRRHPQVCKPQIDHQKKIKPLQNPEYCETPHSTSRSVKQPQENTLIYTRNML